MIKDTYIMIRDFFKLIKGKTIWIVQLLVASIGGHLADLLLPIATANIIGTLTIGNYNGAYFWAFMLIVFYIIYNAFWYWNYVAYGYNFKYTYCDLQQKMIHKVSEYDLEFSEKISKGKIVNTCNGDLVESAMFIDTVVEMLVLVAKLIIIIIIFLINNIYVGFAVILLAFLYVKIMDYNNKMIAKHLGGQRKYADKLTDLLSQLLTGLKEVRVLNVMPRLDKKFEIIRNKWSDQYMKKRVYHTRKHTVIPNIVDIGKAVLYIALIYLVSKEVIKIETLILLVSYFELLMYEANEVMNYSLEMRSNFVCIRRIESVLNYKTKKDIEFGINDNDYIYGLVDFKNIEFKYNEKPILKNISFRALPNQITAVVGHSGSGKSTIINLLLRLYHPEKGSITIDGENIYNYSKEIYSSNVTVVNQKPFIFNMSIRDNFNLVHSNKKRQEEVCRRVGIHDFIMNLPNGYNTVLKEDATDISGGQKQMLSIARALLSDAEILLFDEITSALDPQLVLHVTELLNDLKLDHTIIMVTHKPDLMAKADKIIVLDRGMIVGTGTHDQLIKDNNYYIELQSKKFVSDSPIKF